MGGLLGAWINVLARKQMWREGTHSGLGGWSGGIGGLAVLGRGDLGRRITTTLVITTPNQLHTTSITGYDDDV